MLHVVKTTDGDRQASVERFPLSPNPSPPGNPGTYTRNQISYQSIAVEVRNGRGQKRYPGNVGSVRSPL